MKWRSNKIIPGHRPRQFLELYRQFFNSTAIADRAASEIDSLLILPHEYCIPEALCTIFVYVISFAMRCDNALVWV